MAIADPATRGRLAPILDGVARKLAIHNVKEGKAAGAKAVLRVTLEHNVRRIVQVYWTPFQAELPGESIVLNLEVAEPRVHWGEAYLSYRARNWIFYFGVREDGDPQLLYYADYATPEEALDGFFSNAGWHVLTATDKTWTDVVYEIGPGVPWDERYRAEAGTEIGAAVSESLKKSTIMWLRYKLDGVEQTMPVWFVYDQKADRIYVLSGERQQRIPGAELLREVDVILRWKGKNASVAELPALVRVMDGTDPEWDEIADKIAEKRLNIPGLPEDTARRWRDECVILELTLQN
jgi:hypothetical protein